MKRRKFIDHDREHSARMPILLALGWVIVITGLFAIEIIQIYGDSNRMADLMVQISAESDQPGFEILDSAVESTHASKKYSIIIAALTHVLAALLGVMLIYGWTKRIRLRELQRDEAMKARSQSESTFRRVAEAAPFGLVIMAPDKTFEYLNPTFTEIFGYTIDDVPDRFKWLEKAYPNAPYRELIASTWEQRFTDSAKAENIIPRVYTVRCKDGSDKIIVFRTVSLDDGKYVTTYQDVTSLKKAEESLLRAKEEWERTFNAVEDLITIVDVNHRIIRTNKATAESIGVNPSDVEGMPCYEILEGTSAPPPGCPLSDMLIDGKVHTSHRYSHRLGRVYSVTVSPLYDNEGILLGAAHIAHDVTEQKHAEEELLGQNEFLRTVLESLTYPFYVIDAETYIIVMANSAAGVQTESQGITCYNHIHHINEPCSVRGLDCVLEEVKRTRAFVAKENLFLDENEEMRTVEIHAYPILNDDGKVTQIIQYLLDMTDRKKTEDLLLQTERLRGIGELATGVAHNFNNLLQMVMGSAQVGLKRISTGDVDGARKNLEQILDSSKFGADTVRRLQDFARVRNDTPQEDVTVFDVSEVAGQAAEMSKLWWKHNLERSGAEIELKLNLVNGCLTMGKENEIFEVVVNLVKNAAEALSNGGLITVITGYKPNCVVIQVGDSGPGIAEEHLGKIFDPFWSTKGMKGTGMGLSASYGIVNRYGGTIKVESRPGEGALFTVELPSAGHSPVKSKSTDDEFLEFNLNILAVDDTEAVVSLLRDGLEGYGQTVYSAYSGEEALKIFDSRRVDLVICDLGMPGLTGWDVGKAILKRCKDREIPKTPFVLLTGWGGQIDQQDRISLSGVDRVLEKPLDIKELIEVIREIVPSDSAGNPIKPMIST